MEVGLGAECEVLQVVAIGSLIFDSPLARAHAKGTPVTRRPSNAAPLPTEGAAHASDVTTDLALTGTKQAPAQTGTALVMILLGALAVAFTRRHISHAFAVTATAIGNSLNRYRRR